MSVLTAAAAAPRFAAIPAGHGLGRLTPVKQVTRLGCFCQHRSMHSQS